MNVFEKISVEYDNLRIAHQIIIDELLLVINQLNPDMKIIDVGGGCGNYAEKIASKTNRNIYCIDISEDMLKAADSKNGIITKIVDCNRKFPYPNSNFDLAYNVNFIHYINNIGDFYLEQYRILNNGGFVLTASHSEEDYKKQSLGYYFPETIQLEINKTPSIQEIKNEMCNAGFKNIVVRNKKDILNIDNHFYKACKTKVFSSLYEISDDSFQVGLNSILRDIGIKRNGMVSYSIIRGEK